MKCAILKTPGALEISRCPVPGCGEFDVLVKVDTCGVCRTDRKAFNMGQRDLTLPRILGHEIAGTVEKFGSGVTGCSIGDRVQVSPGIFCGECQYCSEGFDQLCEKMRIIGFHLDGGFAEFVHVPGFGQAPVILNKIPDSLDMATASLAEPLACAINLQKRVGVDRAGFIVIYGAGPLGVLSAKLARTLGAGQIIMVETNSARMRISAECSDYQISANNDDVVKRVMAITGGKGADVVIPCCPGTEPFITGIALLAKRGRFGFFSGLVERTGLSGSELNAIHYREITVVGSYGCSLSDNQEALVMLAGGEIDVSNIPSLTISWEALPGVISNLEPYDHIFTYFKPN